LDKLVQHFSCWTTAWLRPERREPVQRYWRQALIDLNPAANLSNNLIPKGTRLNLPGANESNKGIQSAIEEATGEIADPPK
jgi:hypothetical protein